MIKYFNKKIPSYIALAIIAVSAILVARFTYWEYMEMVGEMYEIVEVKISEKGEGVTFYSGCSDFADFWTEASPEKKTEECNKIFNIQFELIYESSESKSCNLIEAEGKPCPSPLLGTRLVCRYKCEEVSEETSQEEIDTLMNEIDSVVEELDRLDSSIDELDENQDLFDIFENN